MHTSSIKNICSISDTKTVFYLDFFFREGEKLLREGKSIVSNAQTVNFGTAKSMSGEAALSRPSRQIKHCIKIYIYICSLNHVMRFFYISKTTFSFKSSFQKLTETVNNWVLIDISIHLFDVSFSFPPIHFVEWRRLLTVQYTGRFD